MLATSPVAFDILVRMSQPRPTYLVLAIISSKPIPHHTVVVFKSIISITVGRTHWLLTQSWKSTHTTCMVYMHNWTAVKSLGWISSLVRHQILASFYRCHIDSQSSSRGNNNISALTLTTKENSRKPRHHTWRAPCAGQPSESRSAMGYRSTSSAGAAYDQVAQQPCSVVQTSTSSQSSSSDAGNLTQCSVT